MHRLINKLFEKKKTPIQKRQVEKERNMDPESTARSLQPTGMSIVGSGTSLMTSTPMIPGMKMEFPGPPPVYGHGFGPPANLVLDLSPRGVDPSIQSGSYTPGNYFTSFLFDLKKKVQ